MRENQEYCNVRKLQYEKIATGENCNGRKSQQEKIVMGENCIGRESYPKVQKCNHIIPENHKLQGEKSRISQWEKIAMGEKL